MEATGLPCPALPCSALKFLENINQCPQLTSFLSNCDRGSKGTDALFTAGDPDMATTAQVIQAAQSAGGNLCEVGVPYSDPIADGPVIRLPTSVR